MEKTEIIEGSRLIAEYMGYQKEGEFLYTLYSKDKPTPSSIQMDIRNNCKYHSSWDWLIPVINKINKEFNYFINRPYDIETEFLEVVKFIQWINKYGDDFHPCDFAIELSKLHVEEALKQASEKAEIETVEWGLGIDYIVDKDSILNAYPLTNIK